MAHEKLTCSLCQYSTKKRYNLNRHMKLVHKIDKCSTEEDAPVLLHEAQELTKMSGEVPVLAQNLTAAAQILTESAQILTDRSTENDDTIAKGGTHCDMCGRSYASLKSLHQHKSRCKGDKNPLQCQMCFRVFACLRTKYNHKKSCKGPLQDATSITNNNYKQCTINNNNINNNNITINIANFNAEKTEHITQDFARSCFAKGAHGVRPMVDMIYFNDEHPENHNVKIASLNHDVVEVYRNGRWRMDGLLEVIDNMISNSTGTIITKLNRPLNTEDDLQNLCAIQNMTPDHKRKIRQYTKSKLIERRSGSAVQVEEVVS